jgi:diguanylate cyclase (GGDEF)-like protein
MTDPDHVTGLATRGDLERTLERLVPPGVSRRCAVVICDVVGLKSVNKRTGFRAGDAVLAAAARALRAATPDADLVARLGGDELVAVFSGPSAAAAAARAAAALEASLDPRLRTAAAIAEPTDTPAALIDRLYATMRAS